MKFKEFKINEGLKEAVHYMGFEDATPIQEQAIPIILEDRDLIGCAQTGTGKTAAFLIPILHKLAEKPSEGIDTLIIVPTRELAIQIEQQIQGLAYFVPVSSATIYGGGDGKDWIIQKKTLTEGTNIIVATPGKLLSYLKLGAGNFSTLKHLILDEADRMLDMGFKDDLAGIIKALPPNRQNLMFSATMASEIRSFARSLLKDPAEINLALSKPAEGVKQAVYLCYDEQKNGLIDHILTARKEYKKIIIFSTTKSKIRDITLFLKGKNYKVQGISSDLEQDQREEVLRGFRSGRTPILVATDVMSRGIDIQDIDLVINYSIPNDAEEYVHRVGRTARANTKGEAISLINPKDMMKLVKIQKLIEMEIPVIPLPEELGEGPKWETKDIRKDYKNKKWNRKKKFKNSKGKSKSDQ